VKWRTRLPSVASTSMFSRRFPQRFEFVVNFHGGLPRRLEDLRGNMVQAPAQ
jgi:hypothetical protein